MAIETVKHFALFAVVWYTDRRTAGIIDSCAKNIKYFLFMVVDHGWTAVADSYLYLSCDELQSEGAKRKKEGRGGFCLTWQKLSMK